jgi:hypothetical protein
LFGRWNEGGHVARIVEIKQNRHKYPVENSAVTFLFGELWIYGNRLNVWTKPNYISMLSNDSLFVNMVMICGVWGSQSCGYGEFYLLGYNSV